MKYSVHIPLGQSLAFPALCPFSGEPATDRTVRLKQIKTLMLIPLPGAIINSYSTTRIRVPASAKIANLALALEVMIWVSLLGGVALCFWILTSFKVGAHESAALLCLLGAPILALIFRILRFLVVRNVHLQPANDGYAKLQFRSENYAREFSALNHLHMFAD